MIKNIPIPKFGVNFYSRKLKDGSNLFLFQRKGMPVSIRASFFSGSRFDEISGTAHFLEHMLVAGSKNFPSKDLLAEKIESIGGSFSASTDADTLRINIVVPETNDVLLGVDILAEILCYPIFNPKTFESERSSIHAELLKKRSNQSLYIWEVYRKLFMQNTPVGRSTLGEESGILSITLQDVKSFYKKFITSGRLTYIVSGDVDIDELANIIESKIIIPTSERSVVSKKLEIFSKNKVGVEIYNKGDYADIIIGFRACSINETNKFLSLATISTLLGKGRMSILLKKLRYEKGLVYAANVWHMAGPDYGTFVVYTSCRDSNVSEVVNTIKDIFSNITEKEIPQKNLDFLRTKFIKSQKITMQTSDSWINMFESELMFAPDGFSPLLFTTDLSFITTEKICSVAREYFKKDSMFLALCGNKDTISKFLK